MFQKKNSVPLSTADVSSEDHSMTVEENNQERVPVHQEQEQEVEVKYMQRTTRSVAAKKSGIK